MNNDTLTVLYRQLEPRLPTVIWQLSERFGLDAATVSDIAQDTWLALLGKDSERQPTDVDGLEAYLHNRVRWQARDRAAAALKEIPAGPHDDDEDEDDPEEDLAELDQVATTEENDPEAAAERSEALAISLDLLADLPDLERLVYAQIEARDQTQRETAARLGVTLSAVKSAHRRAALEIQRRMPLLARGRWCARRQRELEQLAVSDGRLTVDQLAAHEAHVRACRHCEPAYRQLLAQLRKGIAILLPAPPAWTAVHAHTGLLERTHAAIAGVRAHAGNHIERITALVSGGGPDAPSRIFDSGKTAIAAACVLGTAGAGVCAVALQPFDSHDSPAHHRAHAHVAQRPKQPAAAHAAAPQPRPTVAAKPAPRPKPKPPPQPAAPAPAPEPEPSPTPQPQAPAPAPAPVAPAGEIAGQPVTTNPQGQIQAAPIPAETGTSDTGPEHSAGSYQKPSPAPPNGVPDVGP